MSHREVVLPQTKPETEWVRGRALQKVSPTYLHGTLQSLMTSALTAWADEGERGRVAPEWRFLVAPPGEIVRPLVPDVAYLSFVALAADAPGELVAAPGCAPTVVVEILSPDDRRADTADKVSTYRAAGTSLAIVVDPECESIELHGADSPRTLRTGDVLEDPTLPGFSLDVGALFRRAKRYSGA
ncbi:MAG: Uma2 family endonuclease [Vulcanimicrobiaceae bacterium]